MRSQNFWAYDVEGAYLGVALDKPLGHNDGDRNGVRYFRCPARHGVFVAASRARVEVPVPEGKPDSMDAGFDLSSSETDGSGSFGLSDADDEPPPPTGSPAKPPSAAATAGAFSGAAQKKIGGYDVTDDPTLRLALALQNMVRGKQSREATEDSQLKELFVMPPKSAAGFTIEEYVHARCALPNLPHIHMHACGCVAYDLSHACVPACTRTRAGWWATTASTTRS